MKNKPLVVIDARMVDSVGHGIAQYVLGLASGLQERGLQDLPYELCFLVCKQGAALPVWEGFRTEMVNAPFLNLGENFEIPKRLQNLSAAIYHSPSFASLPYCPCPYVQTIHDLNHLHYGSVSQRVYYRFLLKSFARKADRLLTVSDTSREEIAKWLGYDKEKLAVVYNAIDAPPTRSEAEIAATCGRFGVEAGKYFFTLSSVKTHKNLQLLVDAFRILREQDAHVWPLLLTVDAPEWADADIRTVGAVTSEDALELLQGAGAFLFPSLYEGFGRPPLEAIACRTPVIASDIPAHREALSGLAADQYKLLPPFDVQAWAGAMGQAQTGDLPVPSEAAAAWVTETYNRQHLATQMDKVYQELLQEKGLL